MIMSTTDELAIAAQGGGEEELLALWQSVRRFAMAQARRFPLGEREDLLQAAFEALYDALGRFESERGTFISLYKLCLKTAFRVARYGSASLRAEADPLNSAGSLDAPIDPEDENGTVLADFVRDDDAEDAYNEPERKELAEAVSTALDALPEREREIIHLRYAVCLTREEAAARLHITADAARRAEVSALRRLRSPALSKSLRAYL